MRYLILSSKGKPIDEVPSLDLARAYIIGTNDVIKYIPEIDDESTNVCPSNGDAGRQVD